MTITDWIVKVFADTSLSDIFNEDCRTKVRHQYHHQHLKKNIFPENLAPSMECVFSCFRVSTFQTPYI